MADINLRWDYDRRKMYTHIFFDLDANTLGLAVYAIGKIPGFATTLEAPYATEQALEIGKQFDAKNAYQLFLKVIGKDNITLDEIQQGKMFNLESIGDRVDVLNQLGQKIKKRFDVQTTINIDDPFFWYSVWLQNQSPERQATLKDLSEQKQIAIGNKIKTREVESILNEVETKEDLQNALERIYVVIARHLNPKHGIKEYTGTKKYPGAVPPTFLVSKEYNIAYYPGFQGAQYMTQKPSAEDLYVIPQSSTKQPVSSNEKWFKQLISNTTEFSGKRLQMFPVESLDYITLVLARTFFEHLSKAGEKGLSTSDFQNAAIPVEEKAKDLLKRLGDLVKQAKFASNQIGVWIDLATGKTFKTEQQLLNAKQTESEYALVAHSKAIKKLAKYFLNKDI